MYTNLIVVQRVLRWRQVGWWIRGRELPRERLDGIGGRRDHSRSIDVFIANTVADIGRYSGRGGGYLRAAIVGVCRRRRPDRPGRGRRLHHRSFRVHRVRARLILAFPQLAADKADRNHGPVAANHLSIFLVQPREFTYLR